MATVAEHYDRHLGPVYTWMHGGVDAARARARAELENLGITGADVGLHGDGPLAVDLGAGFGSHAVLLAELGYRVVAIDSCKVLLEQLADHAATRSVQESIQIVSDDLAAFPRHLSRGPALILCMGDTLTHLPDAQTVAQLLRNVHDTLRPGGTFVATFRDYCGKPPTGTARFIAVKSTPTRILTCFLEYHDTHVQVHDLVYQLEGAEWNFQASSYPKLRLDGQWLHDQLTDLGFSVHRSTSASGMIQLRAVSGAGRGG